MILFEKTYSSPDRNISIDEELLKLVNNGQYSSGILRLWESPDYFVVLGLSKKISDDVHEENCIKDNIPILKRCSGGGTVLQGPGCFNYGYILPIDNVPELASLTKTTTYILNKVKTILSNKINNIELKGISDLAIDGVKFSGNAQRRLKHAILFHGTILYDFNLDLISKYLKEPPVQPDYREKRSHHEFIRNISLSYKGLCDLFSKQITTRNITINI